MPPMTASADTPQGQADTVARIEYGWLEAAVQSCAPEIAQLTLEIWFRPDHVADGQTLITLGLPQSRILLGLNNGQYRFGSTHTYVSAPIEAPTLQGWQFVAATCDGKQMRLWPGGKPSDQPGSVKNIGGRIAMGRTVGLGAAPLPRNRAQHPYTGAMARARIWSQARNATDIQQDRDAQQAQSSDALLADWPMNEGSGNVIHNLAANKALGDAQRKGPYNAGYRSGAPK